MIGDIWDIEGAYVGNLWESLEEMMLGEVSYFLCFGSEIANEILNYPVFVINSNAQLSKVIHAPTCDKVKNSASRHPSSPS